MISKAKNIILSLNNLRRIVSKKVFNEAIKSDLSTQNVSSMPPGNVLVLAPHADDETLGCGGAILKHVKAKDKVKVVFFTDGSSGFPEGFRPSNIEKTKMAQIREKEANRAMQVLGVSDLVFMKYKDGVLSVGKNNVNFLRQIIEEFKPDVVYVPPVVDSNHDHAATSEIFFKSMGPLDKRAQIFQYGIWSCAFANHLLNIDDVMNEKIKAIKVYKSQLKCRDYVTAIIGLNLYRGAISGISKYAEGYFRSNKSFFSEYYKLMK